MKRQVFLALILAALTGAAYAQTTLQRCLGIVAGQPAPAKMGPSPATIPFCQQLPAWDLYEQAGKRFQAGDHAAAAKLAQTAAQAGNPLAALRLAMLYEAADGVPRDQKAAFEWYSRAAQAGEPASQMEVGGYYENGWVVREDWVEAAKWYRKSAEQGWTKGEYSLGRAYQFGIGVALNLNSAIDWYERSAAHGNSAGEYFARYLRGNHGLDGSSRTEEEQRLLGPLLGRTVLTPPPVGALFHNSYERLNHIREQAARESEQKARWAYEQQAREYDDCRRSSRDNCHPPTLRPPR